MNTPDIFKVYWSKYAPRSHAFRLVHDGELVEIRSPQDCDFANLSQWPGDKRTEEALKTP